MTHTSRRGFLKTSLAAACGGEAVSALSLSASSRVASHPGAEPAASSAAPLAIKKGILLDMVAPKASYAERFKIARDCGFEAAQVNTTPDPREADEIKKAAEAAGVRIDSVMNMAHWDYPLSSNDPAVVAKSLDAMRTSLDNAQLWGARYVLLVPAVVNAKTGYHDAWIRSQYQIRRLLPLAADLRVTIALEDVWNKFLLSPLEFARYVDEFSSPWVKAWFDVGNIVAFGYPQDWIRTLGKRIVEMHLKDFKVEKGCYHWVNLGDGQIDWAEVREALREVGYSGTATVELDGGDTAYLRDVSRRVDRLVLGAPAGSQ